MCWLAGSLWLLGCQSKGGEETDFWITPNARGFHLEPVPEGWDLSLIRFYMPQPDTLRYEFRRSPQRGQFPWPIQRLITLSATQVGMLVFADVREKIVAVDDKRFIYDPVLRAAIEAGDIGEVRLNGQLDLERIAALQPELVLVSAFPDGQDKELIRLNEMGIPILPISEWQETHPLARAAWVKVIAAICGREEQVEKQFDELSDRYSAMAGLVKADIERPLVLTGSPYQGIWSVPAGESYLATLLRDAGARTGWEQEAGTGSLALDPEAVYPVALEASVWIHPGTSTTEQDLMGALPLYREISAVKNHQVYHYYRMATPDGANAYWETGTVRPDLVLQDLMMIFHPDLFSSNEVLSDDILSSPHTFTYYAPLSR